MEHIITHHTPGWREKRTKRLTKRNNLTRNNAPNPPLAIRPPEQIGQSRPPTGPFAVDGGIAQVQEESQAPALGNVVGFWVEFGEGVREFEFGGVDCLGR